MSDKNYKVERLLTAGTDATGSVVGGVAGALVGGPVGAAVGGLLGTVVSRTLAEVAGRWLSEREEIRVGTAARLALERIRTRLESGEVVRDDEFFSPINRERSDADEVLEATLLKAKGEPEERKLAYIGTFFANVAFRPDISAATAHYLLKIAEGLTYRQLCFLALLKARGGVDVEGLRREAHSVPELDTFRREEMSLHSSDLGMIGVVEGEGMWTDQLSELGAVLVDLLGLDEISAEEILAIEDQIKSVASGPRAPSGICAEQKAATNGPTSALRPQLSQIVSQHKTGSPLT